MQKPPAEYYNKNRLSNENLTLRSENKALFYENRDLHYQKALFEARIFQLEDEVKALKEQLRISTTEILRGAGNTPAQAPGTNNYPYSLLAVSSFFQPLTPLLKADGLKYILKISELNPDYGSYLWTAVHLVFTTNEQAKTFWLYYKEMSPKNTQIYLEPGALEDTLTLKVIPACKLEEQLKKDSREKGKMILDEFSTIVDISDQYEILRLTKIEPVEAVPDWLKPS